MEPLLRQKALRARHSSAIHASKCRRRGGEYTITTCFGGCSGCLACAQRVCWRRLCAGYGGGVFFGLDAAARIMGGSHQGHGVAALYPKRRLRAAQVGW